MYNGVNPPSRVADIYPGSSDSDPADLVVYNNKLYFTADSNDGKGYELRMYNGSTVSLAVDIFAGSSHGHPYANTLFNNKLFFSAQGDFATGYELWS